MGKKRNNFKIILTSRGLNGEVGKKVINNALIDVFGEDYKHFFSDKTIVLFTIREYGINTVLEEEATNLGFLPKNIVIWDEYTSTNRKNLDKFTICYLTEGNTFQIKQMLIDTGADKIIKSTLENGGYYIGCSAGAVLATSSIEIASIFDKNFEHITDLSGLNLLPASLGRTLIIPHYSKKMFKKWKQNTSSEYQKKYNYIDYISENDYKLF